MPRRKVRRKKTNINIGTAWFLGILLVAVLGAYLTVEATILWLILAIAGAIVAILNIQAKEEISYLIATSGLIIITLGFLGIADIANLLPDILGRFLINLIVAFGTAGFIIALSVISKLGATK